MEKKMSKMLELLEFKSNSPPVQSAKDDTDDTYTVSIVILCSNQSQ